MASFTLSGVTYEYLTPDPDHGTITITNGGKHVA
ncbi:hypothetical protein ABIB51_001629 [Arthrobacter sp. UYCu712]